MTTAGVRDQGRESFARRAWGDAYTQLSAADLESPLEPEDVERLATAAYLLGKEEECVDIWARAHHEYLNRADPRRAVRCAFWLALGLLLRGEMAPAGGWFARAGRLLEDGRDCAEQGYLLVPVAIQTMFGGDATAAHPTFVRAVEVGERFREPDLVTLARLGQGQCQIMLGETSKGVALLDEAMAAVAAGEVSPIPAGLAYCIMIDACQEIFDVRRAQEWTAALTGWCASQPDLVPYRGQCLVHRAEIMQLRGAWPDAVDEAERACKRLSEPPGQPAVGMAFYALGELHRLRGEFAEAEEAYRRANKHGRVPQPGLAQLRLAQGQIDASLGSIRHAMDEAQVQEVIRSKLLPAYVEIMLAAGDLSAARAGADELSGVAALLDAPFMHAVAAHATGSVLLAEREARAALAKLRLSCTAWRELDAPYEEARARVLIGLACRELGDQDSAEMELDAARSAFEQLGAAPDLARLKEVSGTAPSKAAGGLTEREVEVLRLVASGKTNRAIATQLVLSEKTVARHISNIFTKLGVSSRSAATAYAYEHDLV